MPLLSVRDLRAWFHTDDGIARAVDGVSFDVEAGETVGLVGESGSGKSVTCLSILRLVPDPPGRIQPGSRALLDGRDLLALDEGAMRRVRGNEVSMIFQEPMTSLNPVWTVGRQIAESVRWHRGASAKEARARAAEVVRLVGIPDPEAALDAYPHQFSGGMRQRAMIAMALACEPRVLLADEPTTALDVTIQAQILELLRSIQDRMGMAVILVTHDLGVVAETAHRIVVMYAGQVVESGRTGAIFREPAHPYTEGLWRSRPPIEHRAARLPVIPGTVPSASSWPSACRFHPRCPYAWARCAAEAPPMLDAGGGRAARCWLLAEPERREGRGYEAAAGHGRFAQ